MHSQCSAVFLLINKGSDKEWKGKKKRPVLPPSHSLLTFALFPLLSSLQTVVQAVLAAAFQMEKKILDSKHASSKAKEMEERFEKMAEINGWDVSHLLIDGLEHRLEWKLK